MAVASRCPEPALLQALLLGYLPDEAALRLEQHVEQCDHCAGLLPTLEMDDTLVNAMRARAKVAMQPSDRSTIQGLIPRLHRLKPAPSTASGLLSKDASTTGRGGRDSIEILSPPQAADEMGRLGQYRVLKLLGQGGMGMVFLAEDTHLQRTVALKAMLPAVAKKAVAKERFVREARAAAKIEHDHIVTIFHVGEDRGVPFLAMQLLKGMSLEDFLRKRQGAPLTVDQILKLGREIARGLAAAHQRGLIHRDIKPANIWLDSTAGGRVKILDFGLARPEEGDATLTQTGVIVGTAAYMAPEQARSEKIDGRADLFSLGCVLYRLCAGHMPWKGSDAISTLVAVASEEPVPVQQWNPGLPPALAEMVMKLLAKRPGDRPATAKAVVDTIQAIEREQSTMQMALAQPIVVAPAARSQQRRTETSAFPGTSARPRRPGSRRPLVFGALLAVLLLLGVLGLWAALSGKKGAESAPEAANDRSLPGGLWGRRGPLRERLVRDGGGTSRSEVAVVAGLRWLADHQGPQGQWSLTDFAAHKQCNCGDAGSRDPGRETAGTGLALLAFLGAGHTHRPASDNSHAGKVEAGLRFLLSKQDKDGSLGPNYAHAINTLALCEAYALTDDPALKEPAQRAINYAVAYQFDDGSFSYKPREQGDLCITTWFLRDFKTAELGGLNVPPATLRKIGKFVDLVASPDGSAYYYRKEPGQTPRISMTASGLLCRQELDRDLRPSAVARAVEAIRLQPPDAGSKQIYYYYHATPMLYNFGGKPWEEWNVKMRELLVDTQDHGAAPGRSHQLGSWFLEKDPHAGSFGRLGHTCLALMTLEVYYRYQPLCR